MGYHDGDGESLEPTAYAIRCRYHGIVYLTPECYKEQMMRANDVWRCPHFCMEPEDIKDMTIGVCGASAEFQDDIYEDVMFDIQEQQESR